MARHAPKHADEEVGFVPVPEDPPVAPGVYLTPRQWERLIRLSRFSSALAAGVLDCQRRGKRGGKVHSIISEEGWRTWARAFNPRARARWVGRAAKVVEGALEAPAEMEATINVSHWKILPLRGPRYRAGKT